MDHSARPKEMEEHQQRGYPNVNKPIVRLARKEDGGLIADISRQTFYETFSANNSPENMAKFFNLQFSRENLVDELNDVHNIFFLAYFEEQVAGYLKLRDHLAPPELKNLPGLEIMRIYSVTGMIGKGIGRLLMQTSIDEAIKRNKSVIWLGVWEHNHRAIDFYQKWGFEKFGEHDFVLGDDVQTDWLMKLNI